MPGNAARAAGYDLARTVLARCRPADGRGNGHCSRSLQLLTFEGGMFNGRFGRFGVGDSSDRWTDHPRPRPRLCGVPKLEAPAGAPTRSQLNRRDGAARPGRHNPTGPAALSRWRTLAPQRNVRSREKTAQKESFGPTPGPKLNLDGNLALRRPVRMTIAAAAPLSPAGPARPCWRPAPGTNARL